MKKITAILISIIIFLISAASINTDVHAEILKTAQTGAFFDVEEETAAQSYDVKDGILEIRLSYYLSGSSDTTVYKSGYAFFIGTMENVYLVADYNTVTLSDEELNNIAANQGVETDKIDTRIELVLKNDVMVESSVVNGSENMGFVILKPGDTLAASTRLRLCEDINTNENGTDIHALYADESASDNAISRVNGTIEDWSEIKGVHYYKISFSNTPQTGMPILNEREEVIGIASGIQNGEGGYTYALQIDELIEVLEALDIEYNETLVMDVSALDEAIAVYETFEKRDYTEESWQYFEDSYIFMIALRDKVDQGEANYTLQDEINISVSEFNTAKEGLIKDKNRMKTAFMIAVVASGVLFLVVIFLIIIIIIKNRKYKKQIEEEKNKNISAQEALKLSNRVTPGALPNKTNMSMPLNKSLNDYGIVQSVEVDADADGTVLGVSFPKLIRYLTGETIVISQNSFIIGSSPEIADYSIQYNTSISRKHICIMKMADGYYVQDLNTTNGTYVNGIRLEQENCVKLSNGTIIEMAQEQFEFRE